MVTYDSRVLLSSSGGAAMLNRDASVRRQAPPRATLRSNLCLRRELRRQEAGFDDEGGRRLSVDRRGRDGLNSP